MNKVTKIIIVDDDLGHTVLLKRKLKALHIVNPICQFNKGLDFQDFIFRQNKYLYNNADENYIIFLDIRLPDITGLEILQNLKNNDLTKQIPMIMISSSNDPLEIEKSIALGSLGFLHKPATGEQIWDTLSSCREMLQILK